MKAPHLRRALLLEDAARAPDGAGGFTMSWAPLGTLWAEVAAGSGRDTAGEEVILGAVSWRITLRALPQGAALRPRPGQRFREGERIFAILAVAERDAGGRWLTCFCREEVPR
ncbi:head-tail adaptor protein [Pseudogemmobacter humi]|uniref:Phage head-tail joining protein n=1 Tax=Pseudogemmobacter humi TaxID=2483812 RepID=A0A3P5XAX0_9RHOB|nr:head-tail adaptor protein [Pseudogemmobacter humi]VDC31786.1 Phage head-tail joining protein [Pseudogemmobacter humi]